MNKLLKKQSALVAPAAERRRLGEIVHDERGNASVSWRDAPPDHERPKLEILGDGVMTFNKDNPYDPYGHRRGQATPTTRPRKDLRKLSEWIKMMRELEERKRAGEEE